MRRRIPGPLATLAAALLLAAGLVALAPSLSPGVDAPEVLPGAPAPSTELDPFDGDVQEAGDPAHPSLEERDDALLWERLGGLASLVLPAGRDIEACAIPPEPPPPPTSPDPVDQVIERTQALRELTLRQPVDVRLVDADVMVAEVEERFAARGDAERVDLDTRVLTALGAIPSGVDLAELRVIAFAEQVSGLHAGGDSLVLVRVEDAGTLSPLERTVLAHELEHGLSFQHLERPADHRDQREHADARRASIAVVEGSATLTMLQYARAVLDGHERATLREELLDRAREDALAGYTPYLLAELRFPYTEGLRFVCALWREGGWAAVNAAYAEPPSSSAEILFPERYGQEPATPRALGEPGEGWERARTTTFGAAELLWLLEAPAGDPDRALDAPRSRASAWAGGRLVVWTRDEQTAVGVALVDGGGAPPLCDTLRDWYAATYPDAAGVERGSTTVFSGAGQHAVVACERDQVRLGVAPGADQARGLVD